MRFAIVTSAMLMAAGSGLAQTPPRPATPQRTLGTAPAREESTANPARKPASSPDSGVNLDVLHTMKTSTEDLNAIRDANLQRVQKGACTPQIAARIAALSFASAAALAENWFKGAAEQPAPGQSADGAKRELDFVLGIDTPEPANVKPAPAETADAELARLTKMCAAAR
jgi:hypothetical protein